jgi:hypothetical protein
MMSDLRLRATSGTSVLDVPWFEEEELQGLESEGKDESYSWRSLLEAHNSIYQSLLCPYANFLVGGDELRSYFKTERLIRKIHSAVINTLSEGQLYSSVTGMIGTASHDTQPGDCLAMLSQCHTPLVLREVADQE